MQALGGLPPIPPTGPQAVPSQKVKILNPLPGGASHIGLGRAERYARKGRLTFISAHTVRFVESHHAGLSALAASLKTDYEQQTNYERISRVMTRREMVHIPVILIK
jgi:hypothetical protein